LLNLAASLLVSLFVSLFGSTFLPLHAPKRQNASNHRQIPYADTQVRPRLSCFSSSHRADLNHSLILTHSDNDPSPDFFFSEPSRTYKAANHTRRTETLHEQKMCDSTCGLKFLVLTRFPCDAKALVFGKSPESSEFGSPSNHDKHLISSPKLVFSKC
jgi:hypothetical protein